MWAKVVKAFLFPITLALILIYAEPYLITRPPTYSYSENFSVTNPWPEPIYSFVVLILIVTSIIGPVVVAWRNYQNERADANRTKDNIFN